ncbi:MAG: recombinase family protein [Acidobacteriota bacterium]|nr:recombinase family protein [Acidobacteriota bacterium]
MKRLFGYVRVSTAKQGVQGVSLQEQRDAIGVYAAKRGVEIAEWFEERQTAAKRGRPVFMAMMNSLRKGKAEGVVIHKIDRSARNLRDWADLGELIDAGIDVHFANEPLDLKSRGGRLSADILAVVAADFIRNNREETRKGFYGRLKQGIYPLNAPLGYLDQGGGKVKALDSERAPLVRFAFERYASGNASLSMLLDELWQKGLRNRRGNRLSLTGLTTILRNPFYTGIIKLRSGETFPGQHEPLIRMTTFARVQDVLTGKKPRRTQVHDYRYRRLFACRTCGRSLVGTRVKGRVYYRCQIQSCPTTCLREDQLDRAVDSMLASLTLPAATAEQCEAEVHRAFANATELAAAEKLRLTGAIGSATERLARLTDALIDGRVDLAVHDERRAALLAERQLLQEKLATVESDFSTTERVILSCLQLARSPQKLYEMATNDEKRQILESVTSNRTAEAKNVEISVAEPFSFLPSAKETTSCAPVGGTTPTTSLAEHLANWSRANATKLRALVRLLSPDIGEDEDINDNRVAA